MAPHPFEDFQEFVNGYGNCDAISRGDWEATAIELGGWHELGGMARRVLTAASQLIATLARRGVIQTRRRLIAGGLEDELIELDHWNVGDHLIRAAKCAYDPRSPFDSEATPTHHIFVPRAQFRELIAPYCLDRHIHIGDDAKQEVADQEYPYQRVVDLLVSDMGLLLLQPEHRGWRSNHLKAALPRLDVQHKSIAETVFRKARETLFSLDIPGLARWHEGRPSRQETEALEQIAATNAKFDRSELRRKVNPELLEKLPG